MPGEPSDEAIEAEVAAQPEGRWVQLTDAIDALAAAGGFGHWEGGEPVRTLIVDGVEKPVYSMPWVDYTPEVLGLLRAAAGVGAVQPVDWMHWDGYARFRGGAGLERASVADCVRVVTSIVRGDRFSEGTVLEALEDGTLLAALHRLLRWHRERSVPPA